MEHVLSEELTATGPVILYRGLFASLLAQPMWLLGMAGATAVWRALNPTTPSHLALQFGTFVYSCGSSLSYPFDVVKHRVMYNVTSGTCIPLCSVHAWVGE